jgi:hypothetical protein
MKLWRWTLVEDSLDMHAGSQDNLRAAMNDIANTVEYIIEQSDA